MHSCRPKWGGASGWQNRSAAPCRTHQSKTDCEEAPEGCWWHNQANVCDTRDCKDVTSKEACMANSNCNWEGQPTTTVPTLFSTTTTPYKREPGRCAEVDCTLLSENIVLCAARSDCLWDELEGGSCGKRTCDTLRSEVRLWCVAMWRGFCLRGTTSPCSYCRVKDYLEATAKPLCYLIAHVTPARTLSYPN